MAGPAQHPQLCLSARNSGQALIFLHCQHVAPLCKVSISWAQLIAPNASVSGSKKTSSLLCPVVTNLLQHLLGGDLVNLGAALDLPMK